MEMVFLTTHRTLDPSEIDLSGTDPSNGSE